MAAGAVLSAGVMLAATGLGHTAFGVLPVLAYGVGMAATLTAAGLRHVFDLADADRPRFLRNPDSTSKWGAENADNQYLLAQIRSDRSYRITGRRGSVWAFLLETKEGYMQLGDPRNFATLHSSDLRVEPDGRFEIVLSAKRRPGNWVELHPDATPEPSRRRLGLAVHDVGTCRPRRLLHGRSAGA